MRVACRIAVTWSFRANMIKGQGGVHAPCEFLSGEALRAMPPDPSAKNATEVQEGVVAKTIKSLGEAMVKLRELACYDKGLGQPIVMLSDTGTRTKRQRLRKGGGQSFSARITNVGPNGDTVWASVIVPPEQTANPTAPGGKSRHFTARLRPHLYPRHDKPIVAALEGLAKILTADELSYIKMPLATLLGREGQSVPALWLRRDHSPSLRDSGRDSSLGIAGVRNTARSEHGHSLASELLAFLDRAVHPSEDAYAHQPLPHFGLAVHTQVEIYNEIYSAHSATAAAPAAAAAPTSRKRRRKDIDRRQT